MVVVEEVPESIANGSFAVHELLGSGCFGKVHRATDEEGREVAIKFEDMLEGFLIREVEVLRKVQHAGPAQGFARLLYTGVEQGLRCLVMDRLGSSLLQHFKLAEGRFTVTTMVLIAEQVLRCLEHLHSAGFVHRDIKPENFLTGTGDRLHHISLTDFGLAVPYCDGKVHLPRAEASAFCGSFRYASTGTHQLKTQSRRDDLEAVGYMLVYLATGSLPWAKVAGKNWEARNRRVLEMKETISADELTADLPDSFAEYIEAVRELEFTDRPDYAALVQFFQEEKLNLASNGPIEDHGVEWAAGAPFPSGPAPIERRQNIWQPDDSLTARHRSLRRVKEKTKRTLHKLGARCLPHVGSARVAACAGA